VLANQRHFALEQAERGVAVRYLIDDSGYVSALEDVVEQVGPLEVMRPAERELRQELRALTLEGRLIEIDHEGWLTSRDDFLAGVGESPPWRMDRFYRHVRQRSGILMEDGKPVGGRYSFDGENRKAWRGEPPAPAAPRFPIDAVKREVGELIAERFKAHPGRLDLDHLPATKADAESLWAHARGQCLPHFGPYEDAMSTKSAGLFHTRLSPLLNLHRLLPRRVLDDVMATDLPLPSREGFVRQLLGWREFVRHIHEQTDGFFSLSEEAAPNHLSAHNALPLVFWGEAPSGLHCLDTVVQDVWRDAYSHHITRLMVLGNIATLLDVSPRELTDWFWAAYSDAYDWVVEPNVLGMATYALGDRMTTKPYVSGAAYIHRMSDFCGDCAFDPKRSCPITRAYWAFLERHRPVLDDNPRLRMPMASARKRDEDEKREDQRVAGRLYELLRRGERVTQTGIDGSSEGAASA
jgi:deoxyribodipyrimidine photolyase-related protein